MGAQIHISGYGARGPGPGRTRDLGPGLRDPHISTSTCRHSCIHTNISKHSCIFTLILYISAHPHINMTTCPHTKPWTSRNRGGPTAPPGPPALRRHSPALPASLPRAGPARPGPGGRRAGGRGECCRSEGGVREGAAGPPPWMPEVHGSHI